MTRSNKPLRKIELFMPGTGVTVVYLTTIINNDNKVASARVDSSPNKVSSSSNKPINNDTTVCIIGALDNVMAGTKQWQVVLKI